MSWLWKQTLSVSKCKSQFDFEGQSLSILIINLLRNILNANKKMILLDLSSNNLHHETKGVSCSWLTSYVLDWKTRFVTNWHSTSFNMMHLKYVLPDNVASLFKKWVVFVSQNLLAPKDITLLFLLFLAYLQNHRRVKRVGYR